MGAVERDHSSIWLNLPCDMRTWTYNTKNDRRRYIQKKERDEDAAGTHEGHAEDKERNNYIQTRFAAAHIKTIY